MPNRRKYSAEYKREAVELAKSGTKPISHVARDLGINVNVLTRWYREMVAGESRAFRGHGKPRDEELATLKREMVQVKKEMEEALQAGLF